MKRYLLFVGEDYYPGGGWHDFARDYATVGAAKRGLRHVDLGKYADTDWAQIVDSETGELVAVWDDLGWFNSIEERTEARNAAYVKRMEMRRAAGQPPPFMASVGQSLFAVATSADLKL